MQIKHKAMAILVDIFNTADLETVKLIHDTARVMEYPTQTVLCHEGEIEHTFYVILEGQVDIYRTEDGETMLLDYLTEGDCFGETALILDVPRTAQVVTSGIALVLEITREDFNELIRSNNQLLMALVQLVLKRILTQEDRRLMQLARQKKTANTAPTVFVSYARENEGFVRKIASGLNQHKINLWVDVHEIEAGKSWARQIGKALDTCKIMLLVLSPTSVDSGNVEDEWNYYLDKGKPIIPVLFQRCDVPYRLHKLHYIDFTANTFESALSQLIANLHHYMK
ncbi:MAG: TIR domain-containing protein [Aggregatilineales bacterium]